MGKLVIKNCRIVNEGETFDGGLLIRDEKIERVFRDRKSLNEFLDTYSGEVYDGKDNFLIPGLIDDQVHFREPGLTHKGDLTTESRAAVAGGITSFMEMPNTVPNVLTLDLLEEKYQRASEVSPANYSFFMGASNENISEIRKVDPTKVCGLKIFMGSSTGNMLVDSRKTLEAIFSETPLLIATHCEDEPTVKKNLALAKEKYGEHVPITMHPVIRNEEACYRSSSLAVELATKYGSRLHILHISTAREVSLFEKAVPGKEKKITSEACIHHLYFCDEDYTSKGNRIKWNPAIKSAADREGIWKGLMENRIDVIATDHAPHTREEKSATYFSAPSGGPLVQHSLVAMMEFVKKGKISIEFMVEKMCHNVARLFQIEGRGFIREGAYADVVLVNPNSPWVVKPENLFYKCQWSPFEGDSFSSRVVATFVNGNLVYEDDLSGEKGKFKYRKTGMRLMFNR